MFMFWPESFSSFYQFINTKDIQTYILRLFAFQQKNLREAVEVLSQRNKLVPGICVNPTLDSVDAWGRSESGQQLETLSPVELA